MKGHHPSPGTAIHCKCQARVSASSFQGCHVLEPPDKGPARPPRDTPLIQRNVCVCFLFLEGEKALSRQNSSRDPGHRLVVRSPGKVRPVQGPQPTFPRSSLNPQVPPLYPCHTPVLGKAVKVPFMSTTEISSPGSQAAFSLVTLGRARPCPNHEL